MSEELPKYRLLDSLEYIDTQAAVVLCPVCRNDGWLAETNTDSVWEISQPSLAPTYVMKDPRGYFGAAPAIPALTLTCTKCGFMRWHNLSFIQEKLEGESGGS
jgi:hypothetical protein